ncbi:MAG: CDP-alcohol phosphatidyltransferase family protein [Sedimenticola sp.]
MNQNDTDGRRRYNKDLFDLLLYPLYRRIGAVLPPSLTPNAITLLGTLLGLLGSLSVVLIDAHWALLLPPPFYILYHLCDTLDGYHARHTEQSSLFGEFLDHALDGLVVLGFYLAVIYRFDLQGMFYVILVALRAYDSLLFLGALKVSGKAYNPAVGPATEVWVFSVAYLLAFLFPQYIQEILSYGLGFACAAILVSIVSTFNHARREILKRA